MGHCMRAVHPRRMLKEKEMYSMSKYADAHRGDIEAGRNGIEANLGSRNHRNFLGLKKT